MFVRTRDREWWRLWRKRWAQLNTVCVAFLLICGCQSLGRKSLEKQLSDAQAYFQRGYDEQARSIAQRGYDRSSRYPDLRANFQFLLAEILLRQEHPADSIQLLRTYPVESVPPFRLNLLRAVSYCKLHQFTEAAEFLHHAEQLSAKNVGFQADVLLARGICALDSGQVDDATNLFLVAERMPSIDRYLHLFLMMRLGRCAIVRGDFEDAVHWYAQVVELSRNLQAPPYEERALGGVGYSYFELGDFEKALDNSQAAADLAGRLHQTRDQGGWLLDTGRAYGATGQFGTAEEYYRRAISLARGDHNDDVAGTALHNLVLIKLQKGDLKQAVELHSEAAKLTLHGDSAEYFRIDEAFIAASRRDWIKAEELLLDLLPVVKKDARRTWMVEAELARVYAVQAKPRLADKWFQTSISTMAEEAARRRNIDFSIAMLDNWPIFDDYIAFLLQQNQPERALQVAQLARARTLAEELGFKPQKDDAKAWVRRIEGMLSARRSVLLAYYEAEHETYVWVVTGNKLEMKALGISQNDLETLADAYRTEVDQHTQIDSSPAQQKLYQILITPVRDLIPHGSHVIVVGDSALYRINFETLISDEGQPHYWIDDAEIENASSIDLLMAESHISRAGKGALIIGAPTQVSPEYPLLPHAHEEVENVKSSFAAGNVKTFEDAAATPDAYISNQPSRFKYIEFASHSDASSSDPLKSTIVLSKDAAGSFQLSAKQIVEQEPRLNAELVSISGCYSGGKIRTSAEGLLGLQWAFMRAGAHQVVAGLWDVDDKSSPQLMGGLYQGITRGESAAKALRAAKLKMIHSAQIPPAPYYWAALQLYTGS